MIECHSNNSNNNPVKCIEKVQNWLVICCWFLVYLAKVEIGVSFSLQFLVQSHILMRIYVGVCMSVPVHTQFVLPCVEPRIDVVVHFFWLVLLLVLWLLILFLLSLQNVWMHVVWIRCFPAIANTVRAMWDCAQCMQVMLLLLFLFSFIFIRHFFSFLFIAVPSALYFSFVPFLIVIFARLAILYKIEFHILISLSANGYHLMSMHTHVCRNSKNLNVSHFPQNTYGVLLISLVINRLLYFGVGHTRHSIMTNSQYEWKTVYALLCCAVQPVHSIQIIQMTWYGFYSRHFW